MSLIDKRELIISVVQSATDKIKNGEQQLTNEYSQSVVEIVDTILDMERVKEVEHED